MRGSCRPTNAPDFLERLAQNANGEQRRVPPSRFDEPFSIAAAELALDEAVVEFAGLLTRMPDCPTRDPQRFMRVARALLAALRAAQSAGVPDEVIRRIAAPAWWHCAVLPNGAERLGEHDSAANSLPER